MANPSDPTWPSEPPADAPTLTPPNPPTDLGLVRPGFPTPPEASRGKSKRLVAGGAALVGVVVLGLVAVRLTSSSSGGGTGASSADGAVRELAAALEGDDLVGVLSVIAPTEIGHAAELYEPFVATAADQGVLEGDDPMAGIDLVGADLTFEVEDFFDDVRKVYITDGELSASILTEAIDPGLIDLLALDGSSDVDESISVTEVLDLIDQFNDDAAEAQDEEGLSFQPELSGLFVMTVEHDGQWYVSPAYTAMEYAREFFDLPEPDIAAARDMEFVGADSPSGVLQGVADFVGDFERDDLDALVAGEDIDVGVEAFGALVNPGEVQVFVDYAETLSALPQRLEESFGAVIGTLPPEFDTGEMIDGEDLESAAQALLSQFEGEIDEANPQWQIDLDLDLRENELGAGRVKVTVLGAELDARIGFIENGELVQVDYQADLSGGTCVEFTGSVEDGFVTEDFDEAGCLEDSVDVNLDELTDFDGFFVVTVERDGEWFMSPVETTVEYLRLAIELWPQLD